MNDLVKRLLQFKFNNYYLSNLKNAKLIHASEHIILVSRFEYGSNRVFFGAKDTSYFSELTSLIPKSSFLSIIQRGENKLDYGNSSFSSITTFRKYQYQSPYFDLGTNAKFEFCNSQEELLKIYEICKKIFHKIFDKLESKENFINTMSSKKIIIRRAHNEIKSFIIFELNNKAAELLYWYGTEDYGLQVLGDAFNLFKEKRIERVSFWVQDSNNKTKQIHNKLGAYPTPNFETIITF